MIFPYVEFLGVAEERIFRPMIPVTFKLGKQCFRSFALIDSGSDYTILPIEIAGIFNLKLDDHLSYNLQGAGGNVFKIYRSPIKLELMIEKKGFRSIKLHSYVYFSEAETTLLLGQKGFLDGIEIKLDGCKKELKLASPAITKTEKPDRF